MNRLLESITRKNLCVFFYVAFATGSAFALETRSGLSDAYVQDAQSRHNVFQAAPVNHIVPTFNTITYAIEGEKRDITVEPEYAVTSERETLKLGGYRVSPYIALSLKHIGLGFSLEAGQKTVDYEGGSSTTTTNTETGETATTTAATEQKSTLDYRAVGVYMYLLPFPKLKEQKMTLTLILGGKTYNCTHQIGDAISQETTGNTTGASHSSTNSKTYPYTVTAYEAGLNFIYQLSKNLDLIPWGQYYYVDTRTIQLLTEIDKSVGPSEYLDQDIQMMWHDRPQLQYGIDLAVKVDRVQIHLGGTIGAVAAFGTSGNKSVKDKSFSLSLGYGTKGW